MGTIRQYPGQPKFRGAARQTEPSSEVSVVRQHTPNTIEPRALAALLFSSDRHDIPVRYRNSDGSTGDLALRLDSQRLRALAYRAMVAGRTYKGDLSCAVLLVPLAVALRVLRTDQPRRGEISRLKGGLKWPPRYDRAKLGRLGGKQTLTHTPAAAVMEPVPGLAVIVNGKPKPVVMQRRIV